MNITRAVGELVFATIIGQFLFFAATPILMEKYGASSFGIFSLSYAIVSIGASLAALKIETLIVTFNNQEYANKLAILSLAISTITIGSCFVVWKFTASRFYDSAGLRNDIQIITVIATIIQAWVSVLSALATRQAHFRYLAINKFQSFSIIALFSIYLPEKIFGNGMVFAILISAMLQLLVISIPISNKIFNLSNLHFDLNAKKEIKSTLRLTFPASALDVISQQLPVFLISSVFGSAILGMYALAARITYAPFSSVSSAISTVFIERFSNANSLEKYKLILKTWKNMMLISLLIYIPIMIFSPKIFESIYGKELEMAGQIARALSILVFFNMIFSPTSLALLTVGLKRITMLAASSAFGYRIFAFIIGSWFGSILTALYLLCLFEIIQIAVTNRYLLNKIKGDL